MCLVFWYLIPPGTRRIRRAPKKRSREEEEEEEKKEEEEEEDGLKTGNHMQKRMKALKSQDIPRRT